MSLAEFLRERSVADVIFEKHNVVEVASSEKLDKALALMAANNIRSVPVYSQKYEAGEKVYQGIISVFDIVSLVAFR